MVVRLAFVRKALIFLLLWLATAGITTAWLPAALRPLALWPFVTACGLASVWYLITLSRRAPRKAPATVIATAASMAGLLIGVLDRPEKGLALAPDKQTVFVLPGPAEQPEKQTVLVPADLLDQLQKLARPALASSTGSVLLSAFYDGKIVEGNAEFKAFYEAYCLNEGGATLAIPLDGVRLFDDVLLDGNRAFPIALGPPQNGYALKLPSAGSHKIELRFRTAVVGTDEDQDVQFAAPRLLQNRLCLLLPGEATFVQGVSRFGSETLRSTDTGKKLDVDFGRLTGPVHLHWFQEALPAQEAKVHYTEAYYWDLRADSPGLTGLIRFDVIQGNTVSLELQLPADLEVRAVEARREGLGGAIRLLTWRVQTGATGGRSLRLRFQSPVRGAVLVGLDLVPVGPFPRRLDVAASHAAGHTYG